jgi:hypothetical protein
VLLLFRFRHEGSSSCVEDLLGSRLLFFEDFVFDTELLQIVGSSVNCLETSKRSLKRIFGRHNLSRAGPGPVLFLGLGWGRSRLGYWWLGSSSILFLRHKSPSPDIKRFSGRIESGCSLGQHCRGQCLRHLLLRLTHLTRYE